MPLKRADALVHIDPDWNIVFPMRDEPLWKQVQCSISARSVRDAYDASLGEEFEAFSRHRSAIEAAVSVAYDRNHERTAAGSSIRPREHAMIALAWASSPLAVLAASMAALMLHH